MSALNLSRATAIFVVDWCNLDLAGFWAENWSLWPVLAWLAVQRSKDVFFLTLYYSINDMKYLRTVCNTPQPCHSHFRC